MSWFDGILLTTEEVDRICCEENQNNLNDLTKLAFNKRLTEFTSYALGDRVEVICETGDEEDENYEEIPVPGVLVGVHFTASEVRYDVAFPIAGSKLWMVMSHARTAMRRISDGKASEFIDRELFERTVKRALGPSLAVVPSDKESVDDSITHLIFILDKDGKTYVSTSINLSSVEKGVALERQLYQALHALCGYRSIDEETGHNLVGFLSSDQIDHKPTTYTFGDVSVTAMFTHDPKTCICYNENGKPVFIV